MAARWISLWRDGRSRRAGQICCKMKTSSKKNTNLRINSKETANILKTRKTPNSTHRPIRLSYWRPPRATILKTCYSTATCANIRATNLPSARIYGSRIIVVSFVSAIICSISVRRYCVLDVSMLGMLGEIARSLEQGN